MTLLLINAGNENRTPAFITLLCASNCMLASGSNPVVASILSSTRDAPIPIFAWESARLLSVRLLNEDTASGVIFF